MGSQTGSADELLGTKLAGRYWIISRLGAGGMGVAYRAWDEQYGAPVVIKIPKRDLLRDPRFAERFYREIRLLQGLSHPHIVPIKGVGAHDGLPFVALRFLPGGSLSDRRLRDENRRPKPNAAGMLHLWLPAVADALDCVHSQGVVHRDVKPANIFFDAFWGAYLGDFGIAKIVEESDTFDKEQTLTATHMGIGTQEYMSPEQFTPRAAVDGRADQYALAVTVYEMLAGVRPFTGATSNLVVEVLMHPVPALTTHRNDLPASLVEAVHIGLAKRPEERFASCREFAAAVLQDVRAVEDDPGIVRLLCPRTACGNLLIVKADYAGKKGRCPKCSSGMQVAGDLESLWLLDEARAQRKLASKFRATEVEPEPVAADPDDEALENFKPVSGMKTVALPPWRQRLQSHLLTLRAYLASFRVSREVVLVSLASYAVFLHGLTLVEMAPPQHASPSVIISGWGEPWRDFEEFSEQPIDEPVSDMPQSNDVVVPPLDFLAGNARGPLERLLAIAIDAASPRFTHHCVPSLLSDSVAYEGLAQEVQEMPRPDPVNLMAFSRSIGRTMSFKVKGRAGGAVWGSNPYTADSMLSVAAVHAGVLRPDQEGIVRVTMLPGLRTYTGSTRNLVQTRSWGVFGLSYMIETDQQIFRE